MLLPDFIVAGAMKSATSTLHHILARHKEVFIPDDEVHFFSVDDITEHPALFSTYGATWANQDYRKHFDRYEKRYRQLFEDARPDQVIGEDSTVYLASRKAPHRIAEYLPDVKLIFLLRDPVDRAYSHYHHALKAGRATYSFEDTLQYGRQHIITRGFYREQIERYLDVFRRDQITVLLFEEFVQNLQSNVDAVCEWLGLSENIDLSSLDTTQKNASLVPRWPKMLAWQNFLFRSINAQSLQHRIADIPRASPGPTARFLRRIDHRLRYFNLDEGSKPAMSPGARSFLEDLYARENRGISDLIGKEVGRYWTYMDE